MESRINSTKKNLILITIAIAAIFLGYLRDSVFKTINALQRAWDLNEDYFLPPFLSFIENYEYETLSNLKWVLTILCSSLYLFLSIYAIKTIFNTKKHTKIILFTYLGVFLISAIFMTVGFVWHASSAKMYEYSRFLMGLAQSPIILMILIPTLKLVEKENSKTSKE